MAAESHNDRLDSWKEIAAYLRRGVRTVQRWEKQEGLPVHRLIHHAQSSVYAYRWELDGWWSQRNPARQRTQPQTGASLAVLPFVNMSSEKEYEYFSDGVTEELISALTTIDGLQVAARTSSFQFKGKAEDVRSIGQKLNVSAVLEGSVRKAGEQLRVTVRLVSVSDGLHLWSKTFEREISDLFASSRSRRAADTDLMT